MTSKTPIDASSPQALLAGGGSGGHVFPGLAIAQELEKRGWQVSWTGSQRGMEARLVESHEIPFHALPARPLVGQGIVGKVRAAATLMRSAWSARSLVRRLRARVVVGTGGYVSAPAMVGAKLASRPSLLVEPNAEPGVANRWLSRFASGAAVAYDTTAAQLRCPAQTTGVPVRSEFFAVDDELPPRPWRILVLGGSQGAQQVNELVPRALSMLPSSAGETIVCHQTGDQHRDSTEAAYREAGHLAVDDDTPTDGDSLQVRYEVTPFLSEMAQAMAQSHLIVSRAGAITLAEICAAGRPSLLVPLALAGGHQVANARRLVEAGAASMMPSKEAASETATEDLRDLLAELLGDIEKLHTMAAAARHLAHEGAAAAIADHVERLGETTGKAEDPS